MNAAPGIVTSGVGSPNAGVEIQPGMIVQPVVLVDQNGNFAPTSGSTATAGYLADLTGSVNVSAATAPTIGQVLTATSGSAATWQTNPAGFADPMTTGGDMIFESGAPAPARLAGNAGSTRTFLTSAGTGGTANAPAWGTITTTDVPFAALLSGAAFTGEVTVQTPVNASDAVTKAYADAIAQGLSVKPSVQEATAAALPANTYNNGSSGVGATLTAALPGVLTVDGITVALGDRILVQDEAAAANNGIYVVTTLGTVGVAYVLTRATDMDTAAQIPGAFAFTEQGTANAGAGFVVASEGPFTIGTTAITWTQFSGAGEITAGTGLTKTGNTIALTVPVTVADGGTGGTTATLAFGNLSPMTTLGDMLFQNSTPAAARLAGNTSATKMFLTQTGDGTVSANPAWGTIAPADMPAATTSARGAVIFGGTVTSLAAPAPAAVLGSSGYPADLAHVHPSSPVTSQTLAGSAASITFSAIPGTYSLLRLLVVGRSAAVAQGDRWSVTVNGDSGAHYDLQVSGAANGSEVASPRNGAVAWVSTVGTSPGDLPAGSATTGVAGTLDIRIPLYAGTAFQKTGQWSAGYSDGVNTAQSMANAAVAWRSGSAITSVTVALGSGSNLIPGTTAYLYLS